MKKNTFKMKIGPCLFERGQMHQKIFYISERRTALYIYVEPQQAVTLVLTLPISTFIYNLEFNFLRVLLHF